MGGFGEYDGERVSDAARPGDDARPGVDEAPPGFNGGPTGFEGAPDDVVGTYDAEPGNDDAQRAEDAALAQDYELAQDHELAQDYAAQDYELAQDYAAQDYELAQGYEVAQDEGTVGELAAAGEAGVVDRADEVVAEDEDDAYDLGAQPDHARRHPKRRPVVATLLVALVVLVVVAVVGFIHVSNEINPSGGPGRTVTVTVPKGASSVRIADILAKADVIHGPDVFEVYLKLEAGGPLLAGTYQLATNEDYSTVVARLEKGPVLVTDKLVVPEGFTIRQMAAAVAKLHVGISAPAFRSAATSGQVRSPYEPAATNNLEGLLFPATYPVHQGESADDLVQYMVDTFDYYASELGLPAAAKKLHYSPYQVVIVASIVEREAKLAQDRGPIASVIYNRLARGMPVGAESTLLYGLGEPTGAVNILQPNPYNTLVHGGLPPTPIASPGIPSLKAALRPPSTTFLYWVEVNPDGKMGYGSTAAQFKQLQRDCQKVNLC